MMSNKLTYKKVLVDSAFRLFQSRSSSDFIIELDQNMECPEGTRLHITEVSIPATFKTTEIGFFEYLYVLVFDNSDVFVKNFRVYLGNKIYFAEQLAYDMNEGMNSNTEDLATGGIFVYSYSSASRTVEFEIEDGLNYKLKIPTDTELKNYVNNQWNTTQSNYDSSNTLSINYLLSNYVATSPIATWTSSYLNLVPFRAVYINSPELADHHLMSPSTYSSSIIRKVIVSEQLGGIINDTSAPLSEDYINVGGKNLKRLTVRITDDKSNTLNLYDIPCQVSLVFSHPSY